MCKCDKKAPKVGARGLGVLVEAVDRGAIYTQLAQLALVPGDKTGIVEVDRISIAHGCANVVV